VVKSETLFGSRVVVMDESGRRTGDMFVDPGQNGGLAVSRRGTAFAYVQTLVFDLPTTLPERIRRQYARIPRSSLQFGSFLSDIRVQAGSSLGVTGFSNPPVAAVGRPALSPSGRRVVFVQARFGRVHLALLDSVPFHVPCPSRCS